MRYYPSIVVIYDLESTVFDDSFFYSGRPNCTPFLLSLDPVDGSSDIRVVVVTFEWGV